MFVRIGATRNTRDQRALLDDLPLIDSAKDYCEATTLPIEYISLAFRDWLNDSNRTTEETLAIQSLDHPVEERSEKISFPELKDS